MRCLERWPAAKTAEWKAPDRYVAFRSINLIKETQTCCTVVKGSMITFGLSLNTYTATHLYPMILAPRIRISTMAEQRTAKTGKTDVGLSCREDADSPPPRAVAKTQRETLLECGMRTTNSLPSPFARPLPVCPVLPQRPIGPAVVLTFLLFRGIQSFRERKKSGGGEQDVSHLHKTE